MNEFDKSDLSKKVAARMKIEAAPARQILDIVFDELVKQTVENGRVELRGLGVFRLVEKRGRKGVMAANGKPFDHSNRVTTKVTFRCAKNLLKKYGK